MALSPAEKQRRYRERKQKALKGAGDATQAFQRQPFFEFFSDHRNATNLDMALDVAGLAPLEFGNDRDPSSYSGEIEKGDYSDYETRRGSIGRAEIMVESFLEAAEGLAAIINEFKLRQIDAEETRLNEAATKATPDGRREIVAQLVKLATYRKRLDANVRRVLRQWEVKDI